MARSELVKLAMIEPKQTKDKRSQILKLDDYVARFCIFCFVDCTVGVLLHSDLVVTYPDLYRCIGGSLLLSRERR